MQVLQIPSCDCKHIAGSLCLMAMTTMDGLQPLCAYNVTALLSRPDPFVKQKSLVNSG